MKTKIQNKNKLFAVVGYSGSGKTTVMDKIASLIPIKKIPTCTSRPPRFGEKEGVDYFFKDNDFFYNNQSIIAPTQVTDYFYGIDTNILTKNLGLSDCFIIVDQSGMYALKKTFSNCYSVLIDVDLKNANERILSREPNKDVASKRILSNNEEHFIKDDFDFVLNNNHSLDACVNEFISYI